MIDTLATSRQLRNEGRLADALAGVEQVLEQAPFFAPAFLDRASLLGELGRFEEALSECQKYLAYAPQSDEVECFRDHLRADALAHFDRVLAASPEDTRSEFRRANIFLLTGAFDAAHDAYRALLGRVPAHEGALNNLANILFRQNRLDEALALYERVAAQAPADPVNNFNLGNVLKDLQRLDEAVLAYQRAVAVQPDFAAAQLELSHCHLMAGRFAQAWPLQEWRWQTTQQRLHRLGSQAPCWLGEQDLEGHGVLLWAEQGLGDTLQFVRFVPQVAARARKVWLRAPATLVPLLRTLDARVEVLADDVPLPAHDFHCPLTSLPLALGLDTAAQLAMGAYLQADAARAARWEAWLQAQRRQRRLRVGVVWQGKQVGGSNLTRDMPLAALAPLAGPDVDLVCLQKDVSPDDGAWLAQRPDWLRADALLDDMGATAALLARLDLVICVDTAIAHLAGALGKRCWLLLRQSSEWRWQFGCDESLWYPGMQLLRQQRQGCWDDVVQDAAARLRRLAAR